MGTSGWCEKCGNLKWSENHKCPPTFVARIKDWHGDDEEAGYRVYAYDAQSAAEKAVERYECDCAEYQIASGNSSAIVTVRAECGETQVFRVEGEVVPSYSAYRLEQAAE